MLRQRAVPGADMGRPEEVLKALNAMFPMEDHAGMYFTMWYGVYDRLRRELTFASAKFFAKDSMNEVIDNYNKSQNAVHVTYTELPPPSTWPRCFSKRSLANAAIVGTNGR